MVPKHIALMMWKLITPHDFHHNNLCKINLWHGCGSYSSYIFHAFILLCLILLPVRDFFLTIRYLKNSYCVVLSWLFHDSIYWVSAELALLDCRQKVQILGPYLLCRSFAVTRVISITVDVRRLRPWSLIGVKTAWSWVQIVVTTSSCVKLLAEG